MLGPSEDILQAGPSALLAFYPSSVGVLSSELSLSNTCITWPGMEPFYFTYFLMVWSGLEEDTCFVLFSPLSPGRGESSFSCILVQCVTVPCLVIS